MYTILIRNSEGGVLYLERGHNTLWEATEIGKRVCKEVFAGMRLSIVNTEKHEKSDFEKSDFEKREI